MRRLILLITIPLLILALILALPAPPAAEDEPSHSEGLVITGARVFDGRDWLDGVDVIVRQDRIEAVGLDLNPSPDLERIDGRGHTLLPGLIDAHTHSFGQAQSDALRFGVTTMLDMFTAAEMLPEARRHREDRDQARLADLYSAGILATARGGHGTQYGLPVPTVDTPEQASAWVAERVAEGSDFIKITVEPGRLWGAPLPTLDQATVSALVKAAHDRGLLAVAHVSMEADAMMAIEAGVDGLVHVFSDRPASPDLLDLAREHSVFVIPTAVVIAGVTGALDSNAVLAENGLAERFSPEQRSTLQASGWAGPNRDALHRISMDNVRALHAASIPLLAGSDAPNPGTAHGWSLHVEMELLVEAGLTPPQALAAATRLPAEHFGLEERGCIAPGCRADLLLVRGNPQDDIRATRNIAAVWKNGRAVELEVAAVDPLDVGMARESGELLSAEEIERWTPSDDRFMNGNSQARSSLTNDMTIRVDGELAAGFAFPYAGIMWSAGDPFMSPVNLSMRSRLTLRVRGEDGPWVAMLFSDGAAQPVRLPMTPTADGATLDIDLDGLNGLDLLRFQAVGVFADGGLREFSFELIEARLE